MSSHAPTLKDADVFFGYYPRQSIAAPPQPDIHARSLFISDLHLGQPGHEISLARTITILEAVKSCQQIYLVGDIFELWALRRLCRRPYWSPQAERLMDCLGEKLAGGSEIILVPGNHDVDLRWLNFDNNWSHGNFTFVPNHIIHTTADGRRIRVEHGDVSAQSLNWDARLRHNPLGYWIMEACHLPVVQIYISMLVVNDYVNARCAAPGRRIPDILTRVAHSQLRPEKYENALIKVATECGVDGIICGHKHHPNIKNDNGITYVNCGDSVEHATVAIEDAGGKIALLTTDPVNNQIGFYHDPRTGNALHEEGFCFPDAPVAGHNGARPPQDPVAWGKLTQVLLDLHAPLSPLTIRRAISNLRRLMDRVAKSVNQLPLGGALTVEKVYEPLAP